MNITNNITENENDGRLPAEAPIDDVTTTTSLPVAVLDRITAIEQHSKNSSIWSNRILLQNSFSLQEKGWRVQVEWKETKQYGIGVFAKQYIRAGTVLRIGVLHRNLFQFQSTHDIEAFCSRKTASETYGVDNDDAYNERLNYVKDYLWGYSSNTDERGYPLLSPDHLEQTSTLDTSCITSNDNRFFGMWVPGNGLNHHNEPNTLYRDDLLISNTIYLVALTDIQSGEELYDDYKRHGVAPMWLKQFAQQKNISLNFSDCNDFVS